ncbi:MAG TPA: Gfo/Idh/MocA family oxidoreductase [Chitinophagaceae bacterium]|nr:Gfo/Idh/MocA family oxidoreductase [Chitinophagaceae bacterium]
MSTRILLIGLGSIGKRHLKNLLHLNYENISVVTTKQLNDEFNNCKRFQSLEDALQNNYDAAFICTPTSLHTQQLKILLENNVPNIYVEKPVGHSLAHIYEIQQLINETKSNVLVGYDLHFHPCILKTKELLAANAVGQIVSANAFVGQHLSQWRPYEDYRAGMSAKKETGGGVLLDLIHEFDYLLWLLGDAVSVAASINNTGALEIETEEYADVLIQFANNISATVHLDYLQPILKRFCIFTGTKGTIEMNLAENLVCHTNETGAREIYEFKNEDRNHRFINIISSFLKNENDARLTSFDDALKSLRIVAAAKQSAAEQKIIQLSSFN